jgi:SAM-dependent methyltransferase
MSEPKGEKTRDELAADQAAFWNGPGGQGWLAAYARIERSIAPFSEVVLAAAAAQPGECAIDVGCGTGGTTAALARAVGAAGPSAGHVLGVDISRPLIEAARAQNVANATFMVGDATVQPFDAQSVDLVFSRFGVMFFADPVAAFRNLRRALKPGGRLVFLCWRTPAENPWGLVPVRAAQPFLPPIPRPGPEDPGQYSFGDRARVERILGEAGFGAPRFEPVDRPVWMGSSVAEVVEGSGRFGPLARAFADATPAARAQAQAAIAKALEPHASADGVALPGACWLVRATAQPG